MMTEKKKISGKPTLWHKRPTTLPFCPGCQHGIVVRAILESVEELGIEDKAVLVGGGGCVYPIPGNLDIDAVQAPQGRAVSLGSTMKQYLGKDKVVIVYQDDNDTLASGTESLVQNASRGDSITVVAANSGQYVCTGWQLMTKGVEPGYSNIGKPPARSPFDPLELIKGLFAVDYLARGTVADVESFSKTKGMIKTAIIKQMEGAGFGLVEVMTTCPTRWQLSPLESLDWLNKESISSLPLGELKNKVSEGE